MANATLHKSKRDRFVEFYTKLEDIENELSHYTEYFEGKIILCNCDDPYESNFFYYFATRFNDLKLKKLICTCYNGSPVAYTQMSLFDEDGGKDNQEKRKAYKVEITEVEDYDKNGATNIDDIDILLKREGVVKKLDGNGDFRSAECIQLLKEADIVVTNPPFSLFREYMAQLVEYGKKFLIIGKIDAVAYRDVFPLIRDNIIWCGYNVGHFWYRVPDYYEEKSTDFKVDEYGQKWRRVGNICWYTNLDIKKRHEKFEFIKKYDPKDYPKYDNYDAINVDLVEDIPDNYWGVMGVPATFIGKYNPNVFEILGSTQRGCHDLVPDTKKYDDFWEINYKTGKPTGSAGSKTNENPNLVQNNGTQNYFINADGICVQSKYHRLFIRRKE